MLELVITPGSVPVQYRKIDVYAGLASLTGISAGQDLINNLRTTYIAMKIAAAYNLSNAQKVTVLWGSLMKDFG